MIIVYTVVLLAAIYITNAVDWIFWLWKHFQVPGFLQI